MLLYRSNFLGRNGLCAVTHLRLTNSRFYVKKNHFEAYLMVSLSVIYSKVLGTVIDLEYFFLIRRQNGECNVKDFRRFLFGMSPHVGPTGIQCPRFDK